MKIRQYYPYSIRWHDTYFAWGVEDAEETKKKKEGARGDLSAYTEDNGTRIDLVCKCNEGAKG